jgi:hypothetical protein
MEVLREIGRGRVDFNTEFLVLKYQYKNPHAIDSVSLRGHTTSSRLRILHPMLHPFTARKVKFHTNQLRDSFAVDLLSNGVSLEDVATLLGNTMKIAEKNYAPWVKW